MATKKRGSTAMEQRAKLIVMPAIGGVNVVKNKHGRSGYMKDAEYVKLLRDLARKENAVILFSGPS